MATNIWRNTDYEGRGRGKLVNDNLRQTEAEDRELNNDIQYLGKYRGQRPREERQMGDPILYTTRRWKNYLLISYIHTDKQINSIPCKIRDRRARDSIFYIINFSMINYDNYDQ